MIRLLLFLAITLLLLFLSRKPLQNPGVHGFYRFFVFEGIVALVLLNHPYWFARPFSPLHLLSWGLLTLSIFCIFSSLLMLKKHGGKGTRSSMPENFSFENTVHVVDTGIYRHIRHPMYSSLLFLGWGAFFKHVSWSAGVLVVGITAFLVAAARVEERENIAFFGEEYTKYMAASKMFIPYFFSFALCCLCYCHPQFLPLQMI